MNRVTDTSLIAPWRRSSIPRLAGAAKRFDGGMWAAYANPESLLVSGQVHDSSGDCTSVQSGAARDIISLVLNEGHIKSLQVGWELESSVIQNWDSGRPSWRMRLESEIDGYSLRAPGWDGYAAKAIAGKAIRDAITFVRNLSEDLPPPLDQPCSDGEVSLVWRQKQRFAEVGFPGDGTFWWYCTSGDEEGSAEGVPVSEGLPPELRRLMDFRSQNGSQFADHFWRVIVAHAIESRAQSSLASPTAYHVIPAAGGKSFTFTATA